MIKGKKMSSQHSAATLYVTVPRTPQYSCCGSWRQRLLFRYAYLLSQYSVMFCLGTLLVVSACVTVSFLLFDPPDFEDPIAGFEPRGTVISQRLVAWDNLMNATGADLPLSTYPPSYLNSHPHVFSFSTNESSDEGLLSSEASNNSMESSDEDSEGSSSSGIEDMKMKKSLHFCGNPDNSHARMVFESVSKSSLFSLDAMQSICSQEETSLRRHTQFHRICYTSNYTKSCCPSWNLGNYVTLLSGKSSCSNITEEDVEMVLHLVRKCSHFYRTKELRPDCSMALSLGNPCPNVPMECIAYDAVFNILHFIVDKDFMSAENPNNEHVSYTLSFLPVYAGGDLKEIYDQNFEKKQIADHVTSVVAVYFNIKDDLFSEYLMSDVIYPCIGVVLVVLLMWMYIGSFFITLMGVMNIAMSLLIAYFVYTSVLQIPFFPFMNLTSIILLVGIGADDTFVFCDIWKQVSRDRTNTAQVIIMIDTLNHAAVSMFVTSFTTASAFFANIISDITSIQCFGIFSGTAILANFILSVTWLPAVLAFHDTFLGGLGEGLDSKQENIYESGYFKSKIKYMCFSAKKNSSEFSRIFFEKILPFIVIKPRIIWLIFQGFCLCFGFVLIFITPKLQLPSLPEFQLFQSSHPFEKYDFVFKDMFWFEKLDTSSDYTNLPVTIVWGVMEVDKGNHLDPEDRGSLIFDDSFNPAHPNSQAWLLNFCEKLRNQSFYKASPNLEIENCFIEAFKYWMESRDCINPDTGEDLSPCCKMSTFPFEEDMFHTCLLEAISDLYQTYPTYFDKFRPGPRFSLENDEIKAIIVEFASTSSFSYSFEEMQEFWISVETWVKAEIETAPAGMQGGWFISDLGFYDLQDNLARGTPLALTLSVAIAMFVMFLTTQNIFISLFAFLSILGTICVTVGTLVLLHWQLNILESVILSVAVGLSIDFTVHYGVAYSYSPDPDRESRVIYSIARMGSAISMAAITTLVAGALMLPASILSYTQMGTFLIIVMAVSWVYSTFFFQSLCRTFGPQNNVGGLSWACGRCKEDPHRTIERWEEYERFTPSSHCKLNDGSEFSISYHSTTAMPSSVESAQELEPLTETNPSYEPSGIDSNLLSQEERYREMLSPDDRILKEIVQQNILSSQNTSAAHCYNSYSANEPFHSQVVFQSDDCLTRLHHLSFDDVSDSDEPALVPNVDPSVPDVWLKR